MTITIGFTYHTTTPESAEQGDHADHGFYEPGGWRYSMNDPRIAADIQANRGDYSPAWKPGALKSAIKSARDLGITEDSGSWFASVDADPDYMTGEDTFYGFHVSDVTPATYRRIARALGCRR